MGLLAGRLEKEVSKVYLALDATEEVIDKAIALGTDMLITHHPLIFSPMKRVTDEDFIGRRVVKLLQNDISYYAMHTNYDVLGMAKLAEDILGIEKTYVLDVTMEKDGAEEGIGRIGMLEREMTLEECCLYVKHKLKLGSVKVYGDMKKMYIVLLFLPGRESRDNAGDKKRSRCACDRRHSHHDGIDAVEQGWRSLMRDIMEQSIYS